MTARRLIIRGRVQGAGYRDWMLPEALRLGVRGWMRNRSHGGVEALAAGAGYAVAALIAACRIGPMLARIDEIGETLAEPPCTAGFQRMQTG